MGKKGRIRRLAEVYHRQHGDDRDRKNGEREDGATYGKAALIFGHGDVSYGSSELRGERAESGFVMINRRFSHLQIARNGFTITATGAARFSAPEPEGCNGC